MLGCGSGVRWVKTPQRTARSFFSSASAEAGLRKELIFYFILHIYSKPINNLQKCDNLHPEVKEATPVKNAHL